jgi:heterodisulfide reductase subunit A-like polyferredoxin
MYRVIGDGAGGVEDALASAECGGDTLLVEQVHPEEGQPFRRTFQGSQVRILRDII